MILPPLPIPTAAWNIFIGGGCLQVISQCLLFGEADDAGDLAACSPAHRTLQLCQAALLPFPCSHWKGGACCPRSTISAFPPALSNMGTGPDLRACPAFRGKAPAPTLQVLPLDLTDSYHVHGQDWNSCRPLPGCQSLRSASLGTASVEGGETHSPAYKVDKMIPIVGSICLWFTTQYHAPVMGSTARTWGG